jgi:hypothetical protein
MEHFLSAEETIRILNIRPFQLVDLIRAGDLHAYAGDTGELIVDAASLELLPARTLELCRTLIKCQIQIEDEKIYQELSKVPDLSSWLSMDEDEKWRKAGSICHAILFRFPPSPDSVEVFFNSYGEELFIDWDTWSHLTTVQEVYDKINSAITDYQIWKRDVHGSAMRNRHIRHNQIDQLALDYYIAQPLEWTVPENCIAVDFRKDIYDLIMKFLFKESEIRALDETLPKGIMLSKEIGELKNGLPEVSSDEGFPVNTAMQKDAKKTKPQLTLSERGKKGGSRNKKNMALVQVIKAAFKNRPALYERSASALFRYVKHLDSVTTKKGKLYLEDDKLMTEFNGKITSVSKDTFYRYVYKIKKELRTSPADK